MTIDDQYRTIFDPCFGCPLNDYTTLLNRNMTWRRSLCCFKNPLHFCSEISLKAANNIGRLCPQSPLMLHEIALNLFITNNNYFSITPSPVVTNFINFDIETTTQLTNLASHFINANSLSFYTDGSLKNIGLPTIKMGVAWLQTDPQWPLISFHSTFCLHNPSSLLAELMAVIAALFVSPVNSNIEIFTDSSSVISNFTTTQFFLSSSTHLNPIFKIPNYPLWFYLFSLIKSKHLTLHFTKVKAHSDDSHNNQVDQLAKLDGPNILINFDNLDDIIVPFLHNMPILLPTRTTIKYLLQSKRFNDVIQLPHFAKYQFLNINWNNTFLFLNDNEARAATSYQASYTKKQKLKFMLEMLPSLEVLKKRSPNLYQQNWTCCRCQIDSEDFNHIWTCRHSQNLMLSIINSTKNDLVHQLQLLNTSTNDTTSLQRINTASFWNFNYDPNNLCFIDLIKGIVPSDLVEYTHNITHSIPLTTSLLSNMFHSIFISSSKIWLERCDLFTKAEKLANITSQDKKAIGLLVAFFTPLKILFISLPHFFPPLGMVTTGQIFGQVATTLSHLDG